MEQTNKHIEQNKASWLQPEVLIFSEAGSQFLNSSGRSSGGSGNPHDFAKGTDVKLTEDYIRNGTDNYFPNHIIDAVKRSMLQNRAFRTISNIAGGRITFQNPDGSAVDGSRLEELLSIYASIGIDQRGFVKPVTRSNYLFGGCPVTLSWNSNGSAFQLANVTKRDYKTFRLSKPVWKEGQLSFEKHFYHKDYGWREERKNKRIKISEKDVLSWIDWNQDPEENEDKALFIYAYDPELPLARPINRTQSFFIKEDDELSDFYPLPSWFSGTAFNYVRSEFLLSCFDIDDIENGLHAYGVVKVYHKSYKDPESGEAKSTFEGHKKLVEERLRGAWNSGGVTIIPVGIDGGVTNDFMEFVETPNNNNRERHTILNERIKQNILSANSAILPELFGIRDEKSVLSESGAKLLTAVKLLNQFTIKPLKSLLDDPNSGFLNIVNDILGIEERAIIAPDLGVFLNLDTEVAKHFLHPDTWFEMFQDFGLSKPTIEQQEAGLIPAYIRQNGSTSITVNNNR